jgi:hypothetical protein
VQAEIRYSQSRVASLPASHSRFAGVFNAFVACKLKPKTLLRVRNSLHGGHGNLELTIAKVANSSCGYLTNPFDHPKITLGVARVHVY